MNSLSTPSTFVWFLAIFCTQSTQISLNDLLIHLEVNLSRISSTSFCKDAIVPGKKVFWTCIFPVWTIWFHELLNLFTRWLLSFANTNTVFDNSELASHWWRCKMSMVDPAMNSIIEESVNDHDVSWSASLNRQIGMKYEWRLSLFLFPNLTFQSSTKAVLLSHPSYRQMFSQVLKTLVRESCEHANPELDDIHLPYRSALKLFLEATLFEKHYRL